MHQIKLLFLRTSCAPPFALSPFLKADTWLSEFFLAMLAFEKLFAGNAFDIM
jgi:hypothetical protein